MLSEEEIIDNLWDLSRLNTYLDLNNEMKEKCEIPREVLKRWFENSKGLLDLYNKEKEKNNKILELVFQYGQIDGAHHKTWVIDQIVRILTETDYDKWVQHYEYDEETQEEYSWDIGIAP